MKKHFSPSAAVWTLAASVCVGSAISLYADAAAEAATPKTRNVILVTMDGVRWSEVFTGADSNLVKGKVKEQFLRGTETESRRTLMPFLWSTVSARGRIYGNRNKNSPVQVANGLKFSYPGYNEILTGWTDPRIDRNAYGPNPNTNVFEWLNTRPAFTNAVSCFCNWDTFSDILNSKRSGLIVWTGHDRSGIPPTDREILLADLVNDTTSHWKSMTYDAFIFHAALDHLKTSKPRVLFLALAETDETAHKSLYDKHLECIQKGDDFVRRIWELLQSLPAYRDRTTLIFTTDHGRGASAKNEWRNHGKDVKGAEETWLAIMGPDTPAGGEMSNTETITQSQIAATICALLGEDYGRFCPQAAKPVR